jgi:hypothetical protein
VPERQRTAARAQEKSSNDSQTAEKKKFEKDDRAPQKTTPFKGSSKTLSLLCMSAQHRSSFVQLRLPRRDHFSKGEKKRDEA